MQPVVKGFFDEATYTITYVVHDPGTQKAAIIDPVLDYDEKSGRTSTTSADEVLDYVSANDLEIDWILETHVHADHLSGAQYLREKTGGRIAIGANVSKVQGIFKKVFNTPGVADDGDVADVGHRRSADGLPDVAIHTGDPGRKFPGAGRAAGGCEVLLGERLAGAD